MTNKEIVMEILDTYGCSNSKQIANLAYLRLNEHITPAQAAGAIRPLVKAGWAGSSKDDKNTTIYWLTEEGKKNKKKEENK